MVESSQFGALSLHQWSLGKKGLRENFLLGNIWVGINKRMKGIKGFKDIYNLKKKSIKVPIKIEKIPRNYENTPGESWPLSGQ